MRYLKPSLLYKQIRPIFGSKAEFASFVRVCNSAPSEVKSWARTEVKNARFYSEKVERPKGMDDGRKSRVDLTKKVGPISWFNLGASGVIIGVMMAFYYYARWVNVKSCKFGASSILILIRWFGF